MIGATVWAGIAYISRATEVIFCVLIKLALLSYFVFCLVFWEPLSASCHFFLYFHVFLVIIGFPLFSEWGLKSNIYTNVSVDLQSAGLNVQSMNSNSCSSVCEANFRCIAAEYSHDNNFCLLYNAIMNGDFETKYRFVIEPSYNNTSFYYKEWQRSMYYQYSPCIYLLSLRHVLWSPRL